MEIVTREEWGARLPRSRHLIDTPTAELWLHHSAGALDQGGNGVWWDDVRGIQNYHMDGRGWSDIAYSFIIGGGQVYEGRGVGVAGGHTKGRNTVGSGICVIGNYESMEPHPADLEALRWLIHHGRRSGWWGELTGPHRDAPGAATSCCGKNLIKHIPDLRRWDEQEDDDAMARWIAEIEYAYRKAGRDPHSQAEAGGLLYWIETLAESGKDPREVVNACRAQLGLKPR